jgi:hypothetical protein
MHTRETPTKPIFTLLFVSPNYRVFDAQIINPLGPEMEI